MTMPTVNQQLRAMRLAMETTILPALPADQPFVQEQAALMIATLDWVADVHESEYRYALAEHTDQRRLLGQLLELEGADAGSHAAAIRAALEAPRPQAGDLAALRAQTLEARQLATAFLADAGALGVDGAAETQRLVLAVAGRQGRREQAWFRMTGFVENVPGAIADVLAEDAA